MVNLNGKLNKINIAVFISGRGSNLKSIIKHSLKKTSIYNVKLVLSDKRKAKGLGIAKKKDIKSYVTNFTNSRKLSNRVLLKLKKNNIKLICLAGFMKIIPEYFIRAYDGKIINIHPSLLPKYKGLNTHKRVMLNKEKFTGCTVHYVSKQLDSGEIILQKKIIIRKDDTPKSIEKKVLKLEHKLYPISIKKVLANL
tara:strand:- start:375 stop:962 length:588 start_codon:yes stop_codon:yes gene_type:complete